MYKFDPKLAQTAAEGINVAMNGAAQEVVANAYNIAMKVGEDNPVCEHLTATFRGYEAFFNDELLPAVNKIHENLMANAEFAAMFNNLSINKVNPNVDVGQVADNNYDAAKDL